MWYIYLPKIPGPTSTWWDHLDPWKNIHWKSLSCLKFRAQSFFPFHPYLFTFLRSPCSQYSSTRGGKSCLGTEIPSGRSMARTTLVWSSFFMIWISLCQRWRFCSDICLPNLHSFMAMHWAVLCKLHNDTLVQIYGVIITDLCFHC